MSVAVGGSSSTQIWFGPDDRPLCGHLALPASGRVRAGVVLCPPMGEESRACHRTFRRLAEELARAGFAVLRFDYDGTGDSAGTRDDPDRVDAWLISIETARRYLLDLGVAQVSAVGLRLGATLAACQGVAGGGFDSLVLWDPCASGRTFLREGEALYAFSVGIPGGITLADAVPPDDGYRHTPGFQYDAATAKAMRRLDVAKLAGGVSMADRILLLVRDDRPTPDDLVARVRADAGAATVGTALDQESLLDRLPSDNVVPDRAIAVVVDWLTEGAAGLPERVVTAPPGDLSVVMAAAEVGTALVRERVVRLGPIGLFGLVSEPVEEPAADQPWIVFVNVAAEHHVGPGRQWVRLARDWAALGYRSVRIDQSGVGESPLHPGQAEDTPYAGAWNGDVADVADHLRAGGAKIGLIGLCSGGYASFEAALRTRIDAIFVINPAVTLYGAARGESLHTPGRRAAKVPSRAVSRLSEKSETHRRAAAAIWRVYRQVAVWHAPLDVPARIAWRGTTQRIILSRTDARDFVEVAALRPLLWRLRRRPDFTLEVDVTLDHSMLTRRNQIAIGHRATAFVRELHRG